MTTEEIKHIIETMKPLANVFSCTGTNVTAYLHDGNQITFNSVGEMDEWINDALDRLVSSEEVVTGVFDDIMEDILNESQPDDLVPPVVVGQGCYVNELK